MRSRAPWSPSWPRPPAEELATAALGAPQIVTDIDVRYLAQARQGPLRTRAALRRPAGGRLGARRHRRLSLDDKLVTTVTLRTHPALTPLRRDGGGADRGGRRQGVAVPNRTGAWRKPACLFERVRSAGPAGSNAVDPVEQAVEDQLDLEAGQVGAEAEVAADARS